MPRYTIEIFDLPVNSPEGKAIGYRVTGDSNDLETDADYLARALSETLSHIGQEMPWEKAEGTYPWPL